jgi:4'-phosphopantetheinyl transferase
LSLLNPSERARWSQFRRSPDRALYLVAHALTNIVLASYLSVRADEIAFTAICPRCGGAHGKPRLCDAAEPIEFSVSHSGNQAVVAVTRGIPIGVDVEQILVRRESAGFINNVLSSSEQEALAHVPEPGRPSALARYWTRKEAILKATGDGLAVAPNSVTVTAPQEPPRLVSWTADPPLAITIHLHDLHPGPEHVGCLAVQGVLVRVVERDGGGLLTPSSVSEGSGSLPHPTDDAVQRWAV